mgnify:CR=1 FL=1
MLQGSETKGVDSTGLILGWRSWRSLEGGTGDLFGDHSVRTHGRPPAAALDLHVRALGEVQCLQGPAGATRIRLRAVASGGRVCVHRMKIMYESAIRLTRSRAE